MPDPLEASKIVSPKSEVAGGTRNGSARSTNSIAGGRGEVGNAATCPRATSGRGTAHLIQVKTKPRSYQRT